MFVDHNNKKLVPRGLSGVNERDKGVFLAPPPLKGKFLGEAEKNNDKQMRRGGGGGGGREERAAVCSSDEEYRAMTVQARRHVWMGAIPLHLHLHSSEVTSLPAPPPFLILAPRNGYLPLLVDAIRPHFNSALPPGSDTIWFDYQGLPLKWNIPTGVLFDLLCAEPERPWNLTVHFRSYPAGVLSLCEDEAVKWNFINALKEAFYVMYGNTKSIMNMSQSDQVELWHCVMKGDLEGYDRLAARVKPAFGFGANVGRGFGHPPSVAETAITNPVTRAGSEVGKPGRIPMRMYLRMVDQDLNDLFDVRPVSSWDDVVYVTCPIDVPKRQGTTLTLRDALMKVVPHLFSSSPTISNEVTSEAPSVMRASSNAGATEPATSVMETTDTVVTGEEIAERPEEAAEISKLPATSNEGGKNVGSLASDAQESEASIGIVNDSHLKLGGPIAVHNEFNGIVRVQGIEPSLDLPLDWVARNLCGPEHFVHLSVICTLVAPSLPPGAAD